MPQFIGVFVTPLIARAEIGVLARITVHSPVVGGNTTTGSVFIKYAVSRPTNIWLGAAPANPGSSAPLPVAIVPPMVTIPAGATHADFDINTGPLSFGADHKILIATAAVVVNIAVLTFEQ